MTKNIVKPEIHISIEMALSPLPGHVEAREFRQAQIQTAARTVMNGRLPVKGPISISLSMSYPPGASMRRGHVWRVVNPSAWDLAKFVLPFLQGICFANAGQVAKLTVEKVYGARPLTLITIAALVE